MLVEPCLSTGPKDASCSPDVGQLGQVHADDLDVACDLITLLRSHIIRQALDDKVVRLDVGDYNGRPVRGRVAFPELDELREELREREGLLWSMDV